MMINRTEVKKTVLALLEANRPQLALQISRVSGQYLDDLEARLRVMILNDIGRHPSIGSTFGRPLVRKEPTT